MTELKTVSAEQKAHLIEASDFTVSEKALTHITDSLKKRGKGKGIRIGVRKTGCSGLAYTLEYVDEADVMDYQLTLAKDVMLYIDAKAWQYLKGATLDYVKRGLNEGFEFVNPNEKGRCGYGESFTA